QGVAVVSMAGDTAEQDTGRHALVPHRFPVEVPVCAPAGGDVDAVADLIDRHRKVTLFCGAGVRYAHAEVVALAERLQAPVGYTLRGKAAGQGVHRSRQSLCRRVDRVDRVRRLSQGVGRC
ncbi:MAG: hypothetical protein WA731_03945, partial [Pseudonocardiaceae bacterium]